VELAPKYYREKEIAKNIEYQGWDVIDLGDVQDPEDRWTAENDPPTASNIKNPRRVCFSLFLFWLISIDFVLFLLVLICVLFCA
jgi:hypothetical protein